jgi:hypothetical protein
MSTTESETDLAGIFDNDTSWQFPSVGWCAQQSISPNGIAYARDRGVLALVVRRSLKGVDYPLGKNGQLYVEAAQARGTLSNDSSAVVRAAYIALADPDPTSPRRLKLVSALTAREMRVRLNGLPLNPGTAGDYWWIAEHRTLPEDAAF